MVLEYFQSMSLVIRSKMCSTLRVTFEGEAGIDEVIRVIFFIIIDVFFSMETNTE
jgi:hypothetical protein